MYFKTGGIELILTGGIDFFIFVGISRLPTLNVKFCQPFLQFM
jgi:hypothetical protein